MPTPEIPVAPTPGMAPDVRGRSDLRQPQRGLAVRLRREHLRRYGRTVQDSAGRVPATGRDSPQLGPAWMAVSGNQPFSRRLAGQVSVVGPGSDTHRPAVQRDVTTRDLDKRPRAVVGGLPACRTLTARPLRAGSGQLSSPRSRSLGGRLLPLRRVATGAAGLPLALTGAPTGALTGVAVEPTTVATPPPAVSRARAAAVSTTSFGPRGTVSSTSTERSPAASPSAHTRASGDSTRRHPARRAHARATPAPQRPASPHPTR